MSAPTATTAREQIRALLNDRAAAITARDSRRALAHYAPRTPEGWRITHEHDSTPFYMDGSDRAATDLRL